jgi:hypothetical protein
LLTRAIAGDRPIHPAECAILIGWAEREVMHRFALLPWVTKAGSLPLPAVLGLPVAGVARWCCSCGLGRKVRGAGGLLWLL